MITKPISTSISRVASIAINDPDGSGFNPLSLFSAGEQGLWYDPSDLSTLFQDVAGTIPVTAAGQPVGLMRDKSGRGNHATQATATSRPILQTANGLWYLAFDGVDDWLQTGNINFTATDKATVFAGLRKLNDATIGMAMELSATSANPGAMSLRAPHSAPATYGMASSGSVGATVAVSAASYPAPHTAVLTGLGSISEDIVQIRVNAAISATVNTDQGAGNYGNFPLYIGMRGGSALPFNGRLYGLIVRGVKSTDTEITQTEAWLNAKTGAY